MESSNIYMLHSFQYLSKPQCILVQYVIQRGTKWDVFYHYSLVSHIFLSIPAYLVSRWILSVEAQNVTVRNSVEIFEVSHASSTPTPDQSENGYEALLK